ncbi:F-box protein skip23 [Thalictrum thalictroides]|uniref:F-box protein skip23 n=1 Tax=Thalictrum thalictroides TaxID=46969 RepID=A0A7J6VRC1_THATH|nr:F-box protein skip23 [Thalictrum thalictroides]
MKKSTVNSLWSELPLELLELITRNLVNYVDYVRLRAVCPSWRHILPKKPHHHLTQLPWLFYSHFDHTFSEIWGYYCNLADNQAYHLDLSEVLGKKERCWGSPHGWLVLLSEEDTLFSLKNPLTGAEIKLPLAVSRSLTQNYSQDLTWNMLSCLFDLYVAKAVLFANPSASNDYIVMVIMENGPCGLAFFQSGTEAWTLIMQARQIVFHDVVCFHGKFYAVDEDGNVYICNLGASPDVVKVADPPKGFPHKKPLEKYLVASLNELLLVYRYRILIGTILESTNDFTVYRLDLGELKWSEVNELGDQVLFLGRNCSFSLSARNYPSCRANSIYFTFNQRYETDYTNRQGYCRGHDAGIFNLHNRRIINPIAGSAPTPFFTQHMLSPPVWVTISP